MDQDKNGNNKNVWKKMSSRNTRNSQGKMKQHSNQSVSKSPALSPNRFEILGDKTDGEMKSKKRYGHVLSAKLTLGVQMIN